MQIIFVFFDSFFKREDCIALVSTYILHGVRLQIDDVGQICFATFIILVGLKISFRNLRYDEGDVSIQKKLFIVYSVELIDKLLQFQSNFWTDYLEWYNIPKNY